MYGIRHKPSGTLFPVLPRGQRRGATHLKAPFKGPPRLFPTVAAARNCLRWWLSGVYEAEREAYDCFPFDRVRIVPAKTIPVAARRIEDMEIVTLALQVGEAV